MKKWLVVLVAMMLTFSLTACGLLSNLKDAVSGEASEPADGPTVTVGGNEDESESEGDTSGPVININGEEEEESEVAEGSYYPTKINDYYMWKGYMVGTAADKDGGDNVRFSYNFETEEANIWSNFNSAGHFSYDKYIVEVQPDMELRCENYDNSTKFYFNMQIMDMSNGEVIYAFPEDMAIAENYTDAMNALVVFQVEESFEGNKYSMGLMSYEGEWLLEMKSDWPWVNNEKFGRGYAWYLGNNYYGFGNSGGGIFYVVNVETQTVSSLENANVSNNIGIDYIKYVEDGILYYAYDGVWSYNLKTGENKQLIDSNTYNVAYMRYDGVYWFEGNDQIYVCCKDTHVATYNMSEYKDADVRMATENAILFTMYNADYVQYLCLMRPDGTMVFEPVKTENISQYNYVNKDKMTFFDYSACILYVCDVESGDVASVELVPDSYFCYNIINDEMTAVIVYTEHSDYGWGYYLVDADNPDELINVLE